MKQAAPTTAGIRDKSMISSRDVGALAIHANRSGSSSEVGTGGWTILGVAAGLIMGTEPCVWYMRAYETFSLQLLAVQFPQQT